jgi:hypothetical protein
MKISTFKTTIKNIEYFGVHFTPPGKKPKRIYCHSKAEQLDEVAAIKKQYKESGDSFLGLDGKERLSLIDAARFAREHCFTVGEAVKFYHEQGGKISMMSVGAAWNEFIAAQGMFWAWLPACTLRMFRAQRCCVGQFVAGREPVLLDSITGEEISKWVDRPEWGHRTYNFALDAFGIFFDWCVKGDMMKKSPTAAIPKVKEHQLPDIDEVPAEVDPETYFIDSVRITQRHRIQPPPAATAEDCVSSQQTATA